MSGLLHLVEAATALTQLGPSSLPPSSAYTQAAAMSSFSTTSSMSSSPPLSMMTNAALSAPSSYLPRRASTHTISDDDDATAQSQRQHQIECAKITTLRENHLQALRVAAAQAQAHQAQQVAVHQAQASVNQLRQAAMAAGVAPLPSPPITTAAPITITKVSPSDCASVASTSGSKETFPLRLHQLLSDPTVRDAVSWLPHGGSFVVLRPDAFAARVLPRYFAPEGSNSVNAKIQSKGVHKYPSFTRKLNRWGFRQISRGPDAGAFCHELFRRDDPGMCRGMVCQKSRKMSTKKTGSIADDLVSVSSASTMGTKSVASCEKRPYSSTVTVSTAGRTGNKSLPFKKRKSGHHANNNGYMMNDIPSMISHRNKMPSATSSVTESDFTSDNGSVCSNNNVAVAAKPSPKAPEAPPAVPSAPSQAMPGAPTTQGADVAREALARHFHEQHRAFALASLMENSRLAMEAAGMNQAVAAAQRQSQFHQQQSVPVLGAMTTHSPSVLALTVNIPETKMAPTTQVAPSAADAAKGALYQAYLQALGSGNSR